MRPCEEGKKCQYSKYDYSEDVECCAIDFDGDACPYVKPWGKRKYERDHRKNEEKKR